MMIMDQKPSVGRIVHYVNLGDRDGKFPPKTQAAVITGLNDDGSVDLKIFYRSGIFDRQRVAFSKIGERGCWNWPPRV